MPPKRHRAKNGQRLAPGGGGDGNGRAVARRVPEAAARADRRAHGDDDSEARAGGGRDRREGAQHPQDVRNGGAPGGAGGVPIASGPPTITLGGEFSPINGMEFLGQSEAKEGALAKCQ